MVNLVHYFHMNTKSLFVNNIAVANRTSTFVLQPFLNAGGVVFVTAVLKFFYFLQPFEIIVAN